MLSLFAASGLFTLLVAVHVLSVPWLVGGPVLTGWLYCTWAFVGQRRGLRS
jgi:hypothetical protein